MSLKLGMSKDVRDNDTLQSLIDDNSGKNDFIKKDQKKSSDLSSYSDDEMKRKLENAVKQYNENKTETLGIRFSSNVRKFERKKSNGNQGSEFVNFIADEEASSDLQQLTNYFFLQKKSLKKKPQTKSYSDYEKQGAIPKYKVRRNFNEKVETSPRVLDTKLSKKLSQKDNKKSHGDGDEDFRDDSSEKKSLGHVSNNSQISCSDYNFILNSNCQEPIVKINEETCSKPFFYIVPDNPSPNFFFPMGSYYIIPKNPVSLSKDKIIFHPERSVSTEAEIFLEKNFDQCSAKDFIKNNLGKIQIQKIDSHLNIGPLDVKLSEFFNNLKINCGPNKTYSKSILSNTTASTPEGKELKIQSADMSSQINSKTNENDSLNEVNAVEGYTDIFLEERTENLDQYENICLLSDGMDNQGDELLHLKDEYFQPNDSIGELQFIFPDADPDFLWQKFESLRATTDTEDAINTLINNLLDDQNYPRIPEINLNAEKKRLWQTYVEKFNITTFIRNVPKPQDFAGEKGDYNKAGEELILKFLESRYPTKSLDFLKQMFNSHNYNLTKTCQALSQFPTVRLSESSFQSEAFDEPTLKEMCYIDHRQEIDDYLDELRQRKEIEVQESYLNNTFLSCFLCFDDKLVASDVITCPEGDTFCKECIKRYIDVKVSDGIFKFACPSEKCDAFFFRTTLVELLPETYALNIFRKQQEEEIRNAEIVGLENCPYCEFAYVPNPENKVFKCQNPACLKETCRKCKEKSHIPLRCEEIERPIDLEARKKIEEVMTEKMIRTCPTCQKKFVKYSGCNRIVCSCGTVMCYICRKRIEGYDHFGKCPLNSSDEFIYQGEVLQVGIETRNQILRDNANIRIVHDPTC